MSMVVPEEIAARLHEGKTDTQVAAEFHMARRRVALMRATLHIPPVRASQAPPTIEAAFTARTRPVDGGHLEWTGPRNWSGVPMLCWRDQRVSAYRVAFRMQYGREPSGMVRPVCEIPGCVAGPCLDDTAARNRTRGQLAAILGMNHTATHCRQGHAYAEHGTYRADGVRYCAECARTSTKGEAA